jgi:hypothetical protein
MPDATHSQHLDWFSFTDVPKMQTLTLLKSYKREGLGDKFLLLPELFPSFRLKTLCYTRRWKPERGTSEGWRQSGVFSPSSWVSA